jgi:hypothetical protein
MVGSLKRGFLRSGKVDVLAEVNTTRRHWLSSITRAPCRKATGCARPAFAGGAIGGECNLVILDTGHDDALKVK